MREKPFWFVVLFFTMAVWATFHPVSKILLQDFSPLTVSFIRLAFALLFFVPYLVFRSGFTLPDFSDWKHIGVNALFGSFGAALLINTGLQYTAASASAVLVNTTPLFVAVIAVFWFKERITPVAAAGLLAAIFGMALVATQGDFSALGNSGFFSGNLLALAAAGTIAIATFAALPLAKKFGSVQAQFLSIVPATVAFFLVWLAAGEYSVLSRMTAGHWLAFAWIGFVVSGICWSVSLEAMRLFGPVIPSSFKTLIPVFAILYGTAFLGESLSISFLAGTALVLGGLYAVGTKSGKAALSPT